MRAVLLIILGGFGVAVFGMAITSREWKSIGAADDGTEVLLNIPSIQNNGNDRAAWIKLMPARNTAGKGDKSVSYRLMHLRFQCRDDTYATDGDIIYYANGTRRKAPPSVTLVPEPIPPGTLVSWEKRVICDR